MPAPLVGFAAGAVGALASNMLLSYPSSLVTAYFDPVILKARYVFNSYNRTLMPDPAQFMGLYLENLISFDDLAGMLKYHNISLTDSGKNEYSDRISHWWKLIVNNSAPKLSLQEMYYLFHSGIMSNDEWADATKRYSFNAKQVKFLKHLYYSKFDQGTIIPLFYRDIITKDTTVDRIRRLYGCDKKDADNILQATQFSPPVSDILRFAVRDVYDDDAARRLQLDSEYENISSIKPWARASGIPEKTVLGNGPNKIERDVLKDYWRAHWQLISPTQAYEGFHRLRPNRIHLYRDTVPDVQPFTFDNLKDLLRAADYLPQQRSVLAATAYKVIGRIDLKRIYFADKIDSNEVYEQFQDQGYNPTDAGLLRDYLVSEKKKIKDKEEEKRNKQIYGRLVKQIEEGYKEGSVTRETAVNTLLNFGHDTDEAAGIINALDIEVNRKRVVTYIKMVKSEFFLGLYTGLQAVEELRQGGVTDIRSNQYVIQWQRQLSRPRRLAGANTVIDWVKRGIISFQDASARLYNLGFSNADTMLYLETAKMDIEKAIQLEEAKQARTEQQQAREAERLQRKVIADIKAAQAQLRTFSPIPKMIKWVQAGLMSVDEFIQRLNILTVPQEDIQRYLIEATGNGQ